MAECDECGGDVHNLWRHRAIGVTVTHREARWVCRSCHPDLPDGLPSGVEEPDTPETSERVIVTDGGRFACPECAGATIDGQGIHDCVECGWSGVY